MRSRLLVGIGAALVAIACGQTDAGITTSVKTRLAADDLVRARNINVDTRERVVTLSGQVRTAEEEAQALQLARDTEGVTNVVDQIEVVPEQEPTTGFGTPTEPGLTPREPDTAPAEPGAGRPTTPDTGAPPYDR